MTLHLLSFYITQQMLKLESANFTYIIEDVYKDRKNSKILV